MGKVKGNLIIKGLVATGSIGNINFKGFISEKTAIDYGGRGEIRTHGGL